MIDLATKKVADLTVSTTEKFAAVKAIIPTEAKIKEVVKVVIPQDETIIAMKNKLRSIPEGGFSGENADFSTLGGAVTKFSPEYKFLKEIPIFHKEGNLNPRLWLTNVERTLGKIPNLTIQQKVLFLFGVMHSDHHYWIEMKVPDWIGFEDFSRSFIQEFWSEDVQAALKQQFSDAVYLPHIDGKVSKFCQDWIRKIKGLEGGNKMPIEQILQALRLPSSLF